jgi:hypothetical protein
MSAGAIIIIVIAASGFLMMRFRKRWLAKINIAVTNRITSLFAGWLPGFGILTHVGRKSGKVYRTPVNVFRASKTRRKKYQLSAVRDATRQRFPVPVRSVLRIVGADEYMELSRATYA